MTVQKLWEDMSKGLTIANLSDKQRSYLIDLAKAEKRLDVNSTMILLDDGRRIKIRPTYIYNQGHGGVPGKTLSGRFKAEEMYLIEFTDTKYRELHSVHEVDRIKKDGFQFEIVKS